MKYINRNSQGTKQQKYFKYYTIIFITVTLLVFSWYFFTGTSFIWKKDGWTQHYKALVYYSRYLRQLIYNIFYKHQFVIPQWDFSLGEGSDILAALHYYVIGDPFTILSALIPSSYMYIYYEAIIILRMYIAGITFAIFCFKTGRSSHYAILAGSLTYVFCYWNLLNAVTHPYFLNPMIYLPLILTGIEKLLKKEKPYLFIITVFLSAVSNFYFFYMLVLLTIIYVAIRFFILYKWQFKKWLPVLFQITASAITGVLMASVILMPVCYIFFNDTRMSLKTSYPVLYPLSYYKQLPVLFTTTNSVEWASMGYAAPVLPAVFLLFYKRRKYFLAKSLFITGIIILLIPFLGKALNGFSYVTNRWSFAFAFICAYILTLMWSYLLHLKQKEIKVLIICNTFYFVICMAICLISGNPKKNIFISVFLAYIFIIIIPQTTQLKDKFKMPGRKSRQKIAVLIIIFSIFCNSYFSYISSGDILERKKIYDIQKLTQNETNVVSEAAKLDNTNSFFRYSGKKLTTNANIIAGISSTQYFWSLSNPCIVDFRRKLELSEEMSFKYFGYDDSAALMTLASVLYYTKPARKKDTVPYGFKLMKNIKDLDYKIYKNKYALPPGYTYENYIKKKQWDKLPAIYKQEALLQGIVIDGYNGKIPEANIKYLPEDISYKTKCKDNSVTIKNNSFVVSSNNAKLKFKFKKIKNKELYFYIKGLNFKNTYGKKGLLHENADRIKLQIKIKSLAGTTQKLVYRTKENLHYNNRHDFTINLGYSKKPVKWIKVTFPMAGTYTFDSIGITCKPMKDYKNKISALKENTLENIETGINSFKGNISLNKPKLLCLPIPYSDGWEAFIDGKKADLYKANVMYMALDLNAGSHNIVLKYHTPFLKTGALISAISVLLFAVWVWLQEIKRKKL